MKNKKGLWGLLVSPPFFFLLSLIFCLFYFGANSLSEEELSLKISDSVPFILLTSQVGMLVLILTYSIKNQQNIFSQTFRSPQFTKDLIFGVLLGLAIAVSYFHLGIIELITYLQNSFGDYVPSGGTSNNVSKITFLFFISNVILAPFVEENIYRNIAFKKIKESFSSISTVVITAVFFGLLHWLGGLWYIVVTAILIGIPFGIIQLKKDSILLVFVAHLTLNLFEFINSI